MKWEKTIACLIFFVSANTWASGEHDFCVDRSSPARSDSIHARFKYGDIDPGREAARVIVSQRYRQVDTTSVTVSDYDKDTCNAPKDVVEEMTVSASPEQLANLGNAVGRGDLAGAGVLALDIAAGASVAIIKGVGSVGGGVVEEVRKFFCGLFNNC
ncbi:hypothetical protein [Pseudomonas chlororaphis]|uniref:hypothetical protein n=1 Tax=Pseudomonas chlororaphis TaxID=587753 RepID=UPI000F57FB1D|nr:hypothetical protein [Pseudomonas chlororaphis]WDG45695.1 hypothetical protein PUP58_18195 [Pseudomonas chlororaphis]